MASPDVSPTKVAIWDAFAWLWNAFVTSLISGAGFYFIAVVVEYMKQYSREMRDRRTEYPDEDSDTYMNDQVVTSTNKGRGAAIFSSYKASAAFLAASAFPRNRYRRANGSSMMPGRNSRLNRSYDGYCDGGLAYQDSSSSTSDDDRVEKCRYYFPPRREVSENNILSLIQNHGHDSFQSHPMNTSHATLLENRIKRKHGIQQWSDIDPVSTINVDQHDEYVGETTTVSSEQVPTVTTSVIMKNQKIGGGRRARVNNLMRQDQILKYLSEREQQLAFRSALLSDVILNRPFIAPFLSEKVLSENILNSKSWSNEALASSSSSMETAVVPLSHSLGNKCVQLDQLSFDSPRVKKEVSKQPQQTNESKLPKSRVSRLPRKRKIKPPETKSKKIAQSSQDDSWTINGVDRNSPSNSHVVHEPPNGIATSSLMCRELEVLLDDQFPFKEIAGASDKLSPWIQSERDSLIKIDDRKKKNDEETKTEDEKKKRSGSASRPLKNYEKPTITTTNAKQLVQQAKIKQQSPSSKLLSSSKRSQSQPSNPRSHPPLPNTLSMQHSPTVKSKQNSPNLKTQQHKSHVKSQQSASTNSKQQQQQQPTAEEIQQPSWNPKFHSTSPPKAATSHYESPEKRSKQWSGSNPNLSPKSIQETSEPHAHLLRSCSFGKIIQDLGAVPGANSSSRLYTSGYVSPTKKLTIKSKIHPMLDGLLAPECNITGKNAAISLSEEEGGNSQDNELLSFEDLEEALDSEFIHIEDVIKKQEKLLMFMKKRKSLPPFTKTNGKSKFITKSSKEGSWIKSLGRLRKVQTSKQRAVEGEKKTNSDQKNSTESSFSVKPGTSNIGNSKNKRHFTRRTTLGKMTTKPITNIHMAKPSNPLDNTELANQSKKQTLPQAKEKSQPQSANSQVNEKLSNRFKSSRAAKLKSPLKRTNSTLSGDNHIPNKPTVTHVQQPIVGSINPSTETSSASPHKDCLRSKTSIGIERAKQHVLELIESEDTLPVVEPARDSSQVEYLNKIKCVSKNVSDCSNSPMLSDKSSVSLSHERSVDLWLSNDHKRNNHTGKLKREYREKLLRAQGIKSATIHDFHYPASKPVAAVRRAASNSPKRTHKSNVFLPEDIHLNSTESLQSKIEKRLKLKHDQQAGTIRSEDISVLSDIVTRSNPVTGLARSVSKSPIRANKSQQERSFDMAMYSSTKSSENVGRFKRDSITRQSRQEVAECDNLPTNNKSSTRHQRAISNPPMPTNKPSVIATRDKSLDTGLSDKRNSEKQSSNQKQEDKSITNKPKGTNMKSQADSISAETKHAPTTPKRTPSATNRKNKSCLTLPRDKSSDLSGSTKHNPDNPPATRKREHKSRQFRARPMPASFSKPSQDIKSTIDKEDPQANKPPAAAIPSSATEKSTRPPKPNPVKTPTTVSKTPTRALSSNRDLQKKTKRKEQGVSNSQECLETKSFRHKPNSKKVLTASIRKCRSSPNAISRVQSFRVTKSDEVNYHAMPPTNEQEWADHYSAIFNDSQNSSNMKKSDKAVASEYHRSHADSTIVSGSPSLNSLSNTSDYTESSVYSEKPARRVRTETSFILKKSVLDEVVQQLQLVQESTE